MEVCFRLDSGRGKKETEGEMGIRRHKYFGLGWKSMGLAE
jgi:hypothetical protein